MKDHQKPESNLESTGTIKRSVFWKIYFFVSMMAFLPIIEVLTSLASAGFFELILILVSIISLIGLYGFTFNKSIYKKPFWTKFFIVYVVTTMASYFVGVMQQPSFDVGYFSYLIIATLVTLPFYYALYIYGKPNQHP